MFSVPTAASQLKRGEVKVARSLRIWTFFAKVCDACAGWPPCAWPRLQRSWHEKGLCPAIGKLLASAPAFRRTRRALATPLPTFGFRCLVRLQNACRSSTCNRCLIFFGLIAFNAKRLHARCSSTVKKWKVLKGCHNAQQKGAHDVSPTIQAQA